MNQNPGRPISTSLVTIAVVLMPIVAGAQSQPYRTNDLSGIALNVLPPGQGRYLNAAEIAQWEANGSQPTQNTDQRSLYDLLIQAAPELVPGDLPEFFKDASFGVKDEDVVRTYSPRAGVVIRRDRFQVPHVYGTTRSDTLFGAGYVTAEDRLFMVDTLRHLARGRMTEFLGPSAANIQTDRATRLFADYDDAELEAMGTRLETLDPVLGPRARQDLDDFTAGINQFIGEARVDATKRPGEYDALQIPLMDWKPTDSIALSALIGSQFSLGGGGQIRNSLFLSALEAEHPAAEARAIFDDFRRANDPEAPTSTDQPFPFNADPAPVDPAAVARPDATSSLAAAMAAASYPDHIDTPLGPLPFPLHRGPASNALLVDAAHSKSGKPIAVFGPQVGYYSPQILMEIDMHGPGIDARGAAFPGLSLYVLLGRGRDYAWSATTAYADHLDIRVVRLCNADGSPATASSTSYLNDGVCTAMYRRTDTWLAKPSAGGIPDDPGSLVMTMTTERTRHGIVQARGTVAGEAVAYVLQRSTYMAEVDSTFSFMLAADPDQIHGVADLQHAFSRFNFSFNWHFVDPKSMGFYTTGLYPVLAPGVDPDLPYWGDSRWDPVRTLGYDEHPQALDPAKGYVVNWNNKQAPLWRAADDVFAFGSIQRVQLLDDGVRAALAGDGKVSVVELVQAMETAATRDIRGAKILRTMLDALGTPSDSRLAAAASLLDVWERAGSHRRDLDLDGQYENQAAVALMDAWWPHVLSKVFGPALGGAFDDVPLEQNSPADPGGSSYWGGWYGQLDKDLRSVLGRPVAGAFSREYCGGGDAAACRTALTEALDDAVASLESQFSADSSTWDVDEEAEKIQFSPVGLVEVDPIPWQNRPTFQQVMLLTGENGVTCPLVPSDDCATFDAPATSRLSIRDDDEDRSLKWRLAKGPAIDAGDFGSPDSTTSYELCMYDSSSRLIGHASMRAGDACGGKPCWTRTARGFRYKDAAAAHDGVVRIALQGGDAGSSKIQLQAAGPAADPPSLPVAEADFPLTVELLNSAGHCWQSSYASALRSTAERMDLRND
ncbi:MAG TPA: penicillin acylase family protein [Candidatus Limnocylindrales bacterium]|nr:penicillin acylase family protein [Candidatus Limnocylindrales bacterium]